MITDYNITECITEDEYENYYRKSTDWDKYYEEKESNKDE